MYTFKLQGLLNVQEFFLIDPFFKRQYIFKHKCPFILTSIYPLTVIICTFKFPEHSSGEVCLEREGRSAS